MLTRSHNFLRMFRIANLLVAGFFLLCVIVPDSWCYGPMNPSPPPPNPNAPATVREIIFTAVTAVWFVSALGLFFWSRCAWFGCWPGIGLQTYIIVCFLMDVFRDCFFPTASDAQHMGGRFLAARILMTVTLLGFAAAWLAFSMGLIVGLIKCRKELK